MRTLIILAITAILVGVLSSGMAGADGNKHKVETIGENDVAINKIIFSTLRFSPGTIEAASGDTLVLRHADLTEEEHTLTIVAQEDLPTTFDEVFACQEEGGPCEAGFGHFPEGSAEPVPVLEEGEPGLDTVGDSLLVLEGEKIAATISASPGTTLYFLCAVHPWMQGSIVVGEDN
jgi:plastocyanin